MDSSSGFIIALPAPIGVVLTALLPVIAIVAGACAFVAYRRARSSLAVVLGIVALLALLGAIALVSVAGRN